MDNEATPEAEVQADPAPVAPEVLPEDEGGPILAPGAEEESDFAHRDPSGALIINPT